LNTAGLTGTGRRGAVVAVSGLYLASRRLEAFSFAGDPA